MQLESKLYDPSLEAAILGTFFDSPEEAEKFLPLLEEEDFYDPKHRKIFSWVKDYISSGNTVEAPIMALKFKENPPDKDLTIQHAVHLKIQALPVENFQIYIQLLKEKAARRKIVEISEKVSDEVRREDEISKVLARLEQSIYDIEKNSFEDKTEPVKTIVFRLYDHIEKLTDSDNFVTGVPSGFSELDRRTTGFQPGELIIIGARPGIGKTSLATTITLNASKEGYNVGFISLEMPKEQIAMRLLANISNIPIYNIRSGILSDTQLEIIQQKSIELARLPIYINDKSGMKITELRAYAKKMKRENNIDLLFVDYLQLVQADKFLESKEREVSEVSRTLKALSIDLGIPVIALAQLNRLVEQRSDKRPMLSDLRNSGQIEQDADLILFLHRPGYYLKNASSEDLKKAEIIIAKQRNGSLGSIDLVFEDKFAKFEDFKSFTQDDIEPEPIPF